MNERVLSGRKRIYTDYLPVTNANIKDVLAQAFPIHNENKRDIEYLKRYHRGWQPILEREKSVRPEINNRIVENHAVEIVSFKVGYEFGSPIQYVQRGRFEQEEQEKEDPALAMLNQMMFEQNKTAKDVEIGEDLAMCGTGYRICLPKRIRNGDIAPFDILTLLPENTFVVYSNDAYREPVLGVSFSKNIETGLMSVGAYSKDFEWRLESSLDASGLNVLSVKPNPIGAIPIVEYNNNQSRMGSFEAVLPLLDALNMATSDRLNDISQFVQSLLWFNNVDISAEDFPKLRDMGGVKTKDNGQDRASVAYLTAPLDQTGTQLYTSNLYQMILTIAGVPDRMSNVSGNTGAAVMLAGGWSIAEANARAKEPLFSRSDKDFLRIVFRILQDSENVPTEMSELKLTDIDVKFSRNRNDSLLVKTQGLLNLLQAGVNPEFALPVIELFADPEMVYQESKQFFEKWKTDKQTHVNNNTANPKNLTATDIVQREGGF